MQGLNGNDYDQIHTRSLKTNDSGFIVTIGTQSSTGNLNVSCTSTARRGIFNKYSADGTVLEWQKCISGNQDSSYGYMFPLQDGNFVLGGATGVTIGRDYLLKKIDNSENIIWRKKYGGSGGELLRDMIQTSDGGYVMLGISNSNDGDVGFHYGGQFNSDIWVLKLDSNGTKEWSTVLGGTSDEEAYSVLPRAAGGYYVLGGSGSGDFDCSGNHGQWDVFLARLDDTGGKVWTKCFGGSNYDGSEKGWLTEDGKGGVYFTSDVNSNDGDVSGYLGNGDFWVVNVDSNGGIVWNKCYGGANYESPKTICRATDGSLWIAGFSKSNGSTDGHVYAAYGKEDAFVVHIDSMGNFLSSRVLGTPERDEVAVLHPLPGGLIFVGGTYDDSGSVAGSLPASWYGLSDVFLARFAPWTTSVNTPEPSLEVNLFPNPASDIIHIHTKENNLSLKVIDITGKVVYTNEQTTGNIKIAVGNWSKGQYYLQARDKNGRRSVTRFLII